MIVITREQALCIFYCEPFTKCNVEKFSKVIDNLKNVEICYYNDPKRPSLQCTKTIYSHPFEIHTYKRKLQMKLARNKKSKRNTY
ncbi:hypothetical protein BY458DRAFT_353984 [Sporodiniella umbellata]|nr:hypothetical protein BY458DRAFT_353984 [Sporodiniella umbellata]